MIELSIPFPPSVNRLWRATKTGKVYRSKEYVDWTKEALWEIKEQAKRRRISGQYKLTIEAVRPDKRKRDIGNLEKAINDALVHSGIVDDDHLCEWIVAKWVPEGPPCLITLEAIPPTSV
jgi:crossover junction endodeoxyribonuclease RusA